MGNMRLQAVRRAILSASVLGAYTAAVLFIISGVGS